MIEMIKEQTRIKYNVDVRNQYTRLVKEETEQSSEEDIKAE